MKSMIKTSETSALQKALGKDYYKGDNKDVFQNLLRNIKPFKNIDGDKEIELDLLEKLVYTYECKYAIMVNYICPVYLKDERRMYSITVRNTDTKELYPVIYASSIYESFVKICLFYYLEISVKENVGLKEWEKK